jgi:hypothetical protein
MECKPRCDTVSMGNLDEVSAGERLAFRSLEHKEAVKRSLGSMDLYRIGGKGLIVLKPSSDCRNLQDSFIFSVWSLHDRMPFLNGAI